MGLILENNNMNPICSQLKIYSFIICVYSIINLENIILNFMGYKTKIGSEEHGDKSL